MSEMLGNQYFMARDYAAALKEFEKISDSLEVPIQVKKKLIVCYTQTRRFKDATKLFIEVISSNINVILETDSEKDDCPCPELIASVENIQPPNSTLLEYKIMMGIIWLYCDYRQSLKWFEDAGKLAPSDSSISTITEIIKNHFREKL